MQPKSVEAYLSGICNQLEMFPPEVRALRRHAGCKKLYSKPTQRKAALTTGDLEHAATQLSSSYDDRLFLAIIFTRFFGLHRLADLTDHDNPRFRSYRKTIMRATVRVDASAYTYLLSRHKADRFFEGNTIRILLLPPTYLRMRDESVNALHPALWVTASGAIPTRSWFTSRPKRLFSDSSIGGHSIRPGGATFYAIDGMPHEWIQA